MMDITKKKPGIVTSVRVVHCGPEETRVLIRRESPYEKERIVLNLKSAKYDMSKIKTNKYFFLSNEQQEIYRSILLSKEGMKALSDLKNEKTDEIITQFLNISINEIEEKRKKKKKKESNLTKFLKKVIEEPLEANNLMSSKSIGLSKEQIWNRFLNLGLVEKFNENKNG